MNEINKLKEEVIFWKNMIVNEINELDEVKKETEKDFKEYKKLLKNPQITQKEKTELTRMRNECLVLITKLIFKKHQIKQKLETLKKKYD